MLHLILTRTETLQVMSNNMIRDDVLILGSWSPICTYTLGEQVQRQQFQAGLGLPSPL